MSKSVPSNHKTFSAVSDTRISRIRPLLPPACLIEELPTDPVTQSFIAKSRDRISQVLHHKSDQLIVIVGPCSIHDTKAALDYASKLSVAAKKYSSELCVVMRTYFEKPRTTVGWKGLINDPNLDNSYQINQGLRIARKLLIQLNQLELPVSSEFLDTISPQFVADLLSWGAIGARTSESQLHRELVSGLSCPIGFKNGTGGSLKIAVDAIIASRQPHAFLGVTHQGLAAIVETSGNPDCHIVLRGGENGPNYSAEHIAATEQLLTKHALIHSIMIDCSHGNSNKKHENQVEVVTDVIKQLEAGNQSIVGLMIESNLLAGNQSLKAGMKLSDLEYGKSITDACVDWETTESLLQRLADAVKSRRSHNSSQSSASA